MKLKKSYLVAIITFVILITVGIVVLINSKKDKESEPTVTTEITVTESTEETTSESEIEYTEIENETLEDASIKIEDIVTEIETTEEITTEEVTTEQVTTQKPKKTTTQKPTEVITEAPTTEVVTEEVTTEELTTIEETSTEEISSESTESISTELESTEESTSEEVTETPTEETPTEEVTTEEITEAPVVDSYGGLSQRDFEAICKVVECETHGADKESKTHIVNVIRNRVNDSRFPSSYYSVCYQKNQFGHRNGVTDSTREAVREALANSDNTQGALWFCTCSSGCWASRHATKIFKDNVGHIFWK